MIGLYNIYAVMYTVTVKVTRSYDTKNEQHGQYMNYMNNLNYMNRCLNINSQTSQLKVNTNVNT